MPPLLTARQTERARSLCHEVIWTHIGWRATKQDTVITSITAAELLALTQAAKETLFVSQLLKELFVDLEIMSKVIECDST
jgi:hypothetical protein